MSSGVQTTQWGEGGIKRGFGGRDSMVINGVYGGRVIVSPWPGDGVGITVNGQTEVIKKQDFREVIDWLKSWEYI